MALPAGPYLWPPTFGVAVTGLARLRVTPHTGTTDPRHVIVVKDDERVHVVRHQHHLVRVHLQTFRNR